MKPNNQESSNSSAEAKPDPEYIAQQLRRPSGDFAPQIGQKMNQVNKPLYDLAFDVMELQKGDRILEIGFGNGKFFDELFSKQSGLQISAIDFSEAMVEMAKEYNRDAISSGKLDIKLGNSDEIPFEFSLLTSWIETIAASLFVGGVILFDPGLTLNWLQSIEDAFGDKSLGYKVSSAGTPFVLISAGILVYGVPAAL